MLIKKIYVNPQQFATSEVRSIGLVVHGSVGPKFQLTNSNYAESLKRRCRTLVQEVDTDVSGLV